MASPVTSRSPRRSSLAGLVASAFVFASLVVTAVPAAAAPHSARLSADLADHLSAGSQSIRVIVHGTKAEVDALAARYNLTIVRYMQSGAVFLVNAGQLAAMRQDESQDHLSGDIRIQSSVSAADAETIGADQAWAGADEIRPQTGKGITVAVIDSGINTKHNAFANGRVLFTKDFTGGDGQDRYGHGTHVAAIIAGQAGKTVDTKDYRGIAPGAYLLNLRVLGDDGSGNASDVIEAIDWTIEHRQEFNVRIINLSLGAPVLQPYRDDPLCEAVERAMRAGLVVVVAAGNYGQLADGTKVMGGITTPANSPFAIAVGAVDTHDTAQRSDDTVATYSSRGPTRYDLIMKPDLAAPGSHIRSAESAGSYLSTTFASRHVSGSGANAVMQLSGTSMAAGFVSGEAALVLDARDSLSPRETKAALQVTSTFMPAAGLVGAGAGLINALAAVELAETGEVPTATRIAGERTLTSKLFSAQVSSRQVGSFLSRSSSTQIRKILHGQADGDTIMWGTSDGDTIMWGTSDGDTIMWGTSLVLGSADGDSILWGTSTVLGIDASSIVWGIDASSIVWGIDANSIVWGIDASSIVWGVEANSIVWGVEAGGAEGSTD